jgi:hypothetical protein
MEFSQDQFHQNTDFDISLRNIVHFAEKTVCGENLLVDTNPFFFRT